MLAVSLTRQKWQIWYTGISYVHEYFLSHVTKKREQSILKVMIIDIEKVKENSLYIGRNKCQ